MEKTENTPKTTQAESIQPKQDMKMLFSKEGKVSNAAAVAVLIGTLIIFIGGVIALSGVLEPVNDATDLTRKPVTTETSSSAPSSYPSSYPASYGYTF